MAARHVGRRIGTVSSQHRAAERRRRSTPAAPHRVQRGKRETLTPGERRHLIQLVACGSIFVLLVAVKLLLPGRMAQVNAKLTGMLEQNIDVQAVFSAVGRAVSGEADVDVALQDMYQAVFDPQEDSAVEVSAPAGGEAVSLQLPAAIAPLRAFRTGTGSSDGWLDLPTAETEETGQAAGTDPAAETAETAAQGGAEASTLAYVLYSDRNLPDNVCGIVADCGYTSPREITRKCLPEYLPGFPLGPTYAIGRLGAILFGHFDPEDADCTDAAAHSKVPIFFVHGDADGFVPYEMGRRNYEVCRAKGKRFLTVHGAEHAVSYYHDNTAYTKECTDFLQDCLTRRHFAWPKEASDDAR